MEEILCNKTEWCLIGRILNLEFIGKDVVFYGAGCHLYFTNINTLEKLTYTANDEQHGDGISSYKGHRTLNFFCFSEDNGNPNIFVMNYPKFEIISILEGGSKEGYTALVLSESSLLISLGSLPYFNLTVWNWRTGEKLGSSRSHIYRQKQVLRCNTHNPVRISQLGHKTSKLHIWDILKCGKKCIMTHHNVKLPQEKPAPLVLTQWSQDGLLYVLDYDGSIFIVNTEYVLEKIITQNKIGNKSPYFTLWKNEIVIAGPSNGIRFYKRATNSWNLYRTLTPEERVVQIRSNKNDDLLGLTDRYYVVKIDAENKKYEFINSKETEIHNMCMLYPVGQFVCVLSQGNMISVIEIATGDVVSRYDLMGTALTMAANPEFPYIGIGYINGILELVSLYDFTKPVSMTHFTLTTNQISSVHFSEFGRVLVAADTAVGEFFILEGIPGGNIKVVATVSMNFQVADYMLVPSINCYRLFVIPVTSNDFIKGNKVIRYCIMSSNEIRIKEYRYQDRNKYMCKILSTSKINRDRVFYVIPSNMRCIEEVETRRGEDLLRIVNTHETGHQVRRIGMYIDKYHAITWSHGGAAVVRTTDLNQVLGCSFAHHRRDGGIKKALVDPTGKYVITLGHDNIIVCTNFVQNEPNEQLQEDLQKLLDSDRYALLFQRKTKGFDPGPSMRNYTWLEVEKLGKIEKERKMCENEKSAIYAEYHEIRNELRSLLNQNLDGPENEKLDLVEFNLDTVYFDEMRENNRVECKETEQYIKKYTAAMYGVCEKMKSLFYNSMAVHNRKMLALSSPVKVDCYSLLSVTGEEMEELNWVTEQLKLEKLVSEGDMFEPWKPMPSDKLTNFLSQPPQFQEVKKKNQVDDLEETSEIFILDPESLTAMAGTTARNFIDISPYKYNQFEIQTFYQLLKLTNFLSQPPQFQEVKKKNQVDDLEETSEIFILDPESLTAMAGTTARNFIDISPYKYNQFEIQTFYQLQLASVITNHDSVRLREYFNKEFEKILQLKVREIGQIKEKNQRLRHIVDEINYFSTDQIYLVIKDPVWSAFEDLEKIVCIQDSEVPISPYISPSEQAILDAKAAEAERIRLLLLADDFKERALMAMMNGVLEVRWEDELKKEVPLPKCMIEKEPEDFNEEDLRAVKDYEEKVKFLNSERDRYKHLLDQEYTKIVAQMRESVRKFDSRVSDLLQLKIKVDEARVQEVLILCKERIKLLDLLTHEQKELELKKMMVANKELINSLERLIESLQESVMECRGQIEVVQNREKYLDKTLKKDMSEFNQVIQEVSIKLLKKRPKVNYKNLASSTLLQTLAKAVIARERAPTLTDECLEYLNSLDAMDSYAGVPPTVDEEAYAVICKHRRLRIEHEIKLKSSSVDLMEAEATVSVLQKRLNQKKELNVHCMAELAQIRTNRLKTLKNIQMQIVLKQGYVEVPMNGNISDFEDAILVSRKEVEEINSFILENGRIKLNTMRHTMTFHREIMKMEWTHKKLRMHIEDLKEELNDISLLKMTKEMQNYLKGKEKILPFEVGLEMLKNSYELMLKEKKVNVDKLQKQIKLLRHQSKKLDSEISDVNVDVCECKLDKDWVLDAEAKKQLNDRMLSLARRSKLIKKVQSNHQTILLLQTELELLRLKTYPTIKYKILS